GRRGSCAHIRAGRVSRRRTRRSRGSPRLARVRSQKSVAHEVAGSRFLKKRRWEFRDSLHGGNLARVLRYTGSMPGAAGGAVASSAHPTSHEESSLPSDNHLTAQGDFSCTVIFLFPDGARSSRAGKCARPAHTAAGTQRPPGGGRPGGGSAALAAARANHKVFRAKRRSLPVHAAAVCLPE